MFIRKLVGTATAVLFVGAAAFAQTAPSSTTHKESVATRDTAQAVTVAGCLMKESDYRKAHGLGHGPMTGTDFVLVEGNCTDTASGTAYRLAGPVEGKMKSLAGHRVEVTGRFDHSRDARAAAGQRTAKMPPEIRVESFREAAATVSSTATESQPATTAPSEPPAPAVTAPATVAPAPVETAPAPTGTSGQPPASTAPARRMPKTASNEPLFALFGGLCLTASLGVRFLRGLAS